MLKADLTEQQIAERAIFVERIIGGGWNPGKFNTLFESGVKVSPEAHAEYNAPDVYLSLEYHVQERYLSLFIREKNSENHIRFRFYYGEHLEQVLKLIIDFQHTLSIHNYTDLIKAMSGICENVFWEIEGQPLLRVTYGDTIVSDLETNCEQVNETELAQQAQEPISQKIQALSESTQPALSCEKEAEGSVDDLLTIIRAATAISQLSLQQLRVATIIAKTLQHEPDPSKGLLNEENLLRNSCEWIEVGRCELIVLMPTHDGATRNPERGTAYFDPLVKYPRRGGEYPPEPSVKNSRNISYRPADALGGVTKSGKLLEIMNPDRLSESELRQFLIDGVQRGVAQIWSTQPLAIGNTTTVDQPLMSGNLVNSVRIQNVSERVASCTSSMDIAAPQVKSILKEAEALNKLDRAFLSEEKHSKLFWHLAKEKLSNTILNQFRNIICNEKDIKDNAE